MTLSQKAPAARFSATAMVMGCCALPIDAAWLDMLRTFEPLELYALTRIAADTLSVIGTGFSKLADGLYDLVHRRHRRPTLSPTSPTVLRSRHRDGSGR